MHDSLPTFSKLKSRGINVQIICPLCNSEDESSTHLFLYCQFSRAIWLGSALNIHTSNLCNIPVQWWISSLLIRNKRMTPDAMIFLQILFTTLWSIWYHRNLVADNGIQPNPMDVILMVQNLSCRYHDAFSNEESQHSQGHRCSNPQSSVGGNWQLSSN